MKAIVSFMLGVALTASAMTYAQTPARTPLFIGLFSTGPAWETDKPPDQQKFMREHSQNLGRLRREKKILLGARYADKGAVVMESATAEEARAWFDADPSIGAGVFKFEVVPFNLFYPGCVGPPPAQ